jgi:hypothetical protein
MSQNTILGEPLEIIAMIAAPSIDPPSGVVIFKCAGKTLGVVNVDNLGLAKLKISSDILGVGTHYIDVYFAGNKQFAASKALNIVKTITYT